MAWYKIRNQYSSPSNGRQGDMQAGTCTQEHRIQSFYLYGLIIQARSGSVRYMYKSSKTGYDGNRSPWTTNGLAHGCNIDYHATFIGIPRSFCVGFACIWHSGFLEPTNKVILSLSLFYGRCHEEIPDDIRFRGVSFSRIFLILWNKFG